MRWAGGQLLLETSSIPLNGIRVVPEVSGGWLADSSRATELASISPEGADSSSYLETRPLSPSGASPEASSGPLDASTVLPDASSISQDAGPGWFLHPASRRMRPAAPGSVTRLAGWIRHLAGSITQTASRSSASLDASPDRPDASGNSLDTETRRFLDPAPRRMRPMGRWMRHPAAGCIRHLARRITQPVSSSGVSPDASNGSLDASPGSLDESGSTPNLGFSTS
jgi:hypothetical protein